jgi:anti-anti-sigma factor
MRRTPTAHPTGRAPFAGWPRLQISVKVQRAAVCRIDVEGEIDLATVPELTAVIHQVPPTRGRVLVLDATGITFCDCAGLTALLDTHHRLRDAGGALAIVYPPPRLRRLFDASGLAGELDVWPSHPAPGLDRDTTDAGRRNDVDSSLS